MENKYMNTKEENCKLGLEELEDVAGGRKWGDTAGSGMGLKGLFSSLRRKSFITGAVGKGDDSLASRYAAENDPGRDSVI